MTVGCVGGRWKDDRERATRTILGPLCGVRGWVAYRIASGQDGAFTAQERKPPCDRARRPSNLISRAFKLYLISSATDVDTVSNSTQMQHERRSWQSQSRIGSMVATIVQYSTERQVGRRAQLDSREWGVLY